MDIKKIINSFVDAHADEIEAAIRSALVKESPISEIKEGDHFEYKGLEWVCLDVTTETVFAITAKIIADMPFNDECEDGCNNWEKSTLRRFLNEDVLEEHFDTKHLVKQTSDLIADNGDKAYGTCEDYITLLTCDQYRKYRDYVPLFEKCMWTLTPLSCSAGRAYGVRGIGPSEALGSCNVSIAHGVAPVCLFKLDQLVSCGQARIITTK